MKSDESTSPFDPARLPTECDSGQAAPDLPPTIVDDETLDQEVLRGMGEFLDRLSRFWRPNGASHDDSDSDSDPKMASGTGSFERYELLERVGQGGFGLVFRARDPVLNREVALKIPRPEVLITRSLRRRFLREARASAALDHANIVQVYDTGQVGPLCYISSAFCKGPTLGFWLTRCVGPVAVKPAARLIRTLAVAVQHAHDRGILHRDLKPSNILLQGDPNDPDLDTFEPRISDFGLAKIADEVGSDTRTDSPMGSPPYMAPEQALGRSNEVGPASDVYALGAILYQVLTGRPPFEGDSRVELLRHIVETEPVSPRVIRHDLPRDLETICLKCLQKDPRLRYSSPQGLADDLGRYLRGESVEARPISIWRRASKWCRRKPWQASAALLVCASILATTGGILWRDGILRRHNVELTSALDLAKQYQAETRRLLYDSQVRLAQQALDSGNAEMSQEILAGLTPEQGQTDLRGFECFYLDRTARRDVSLLIDHPTGIDYLILSPDGRTLVLADDEGRIFFWDVSEERERSRTRTNAGGFGGLIYSPDGTRVVSWTSPKVQPTEVKLWDPSTGSEVASIPVESGGVVHDVSLSGDGHTLTIREFHESRSRYALWELSRGSNHPSQLGEKLDCEDLAFSPDGRWLATVDREHPGSVTLRDPSTRRPIRSISSGSPGILSMIFTPDGTRLAASLPQSLVVWETDSGREIAAFSKTSSARLKLSPDGDRLAAISHDGLNYCLIVDLKTQPRLCIPETSGGRNLRITFSMDGQALAVGGLGMYPAIWDTTTGQNTAVHPKKTKELGGLAFTSDGQSLIFAGDDGRVRNWHFGQHCEPLTEIAKGDKEVWALAYSPDGSTLASAGDDHLIKLWNSRDGTLKATLKGHGALVTSIAFSPAGTRLASSGFDNAVRIWDFGKAKSLEVLTGHTNRVRAVAFSPDGRLLASAGSDMRVRMWDANLGQPRWTFQGHEDSVHAVVFNHDGSLLVSASNDRTIRGIDVVTGLERFSLASPRPNIAVAFSANGSLLASTDDMGDVTLWDQTTWKRRITIKGSDSSVWGLAFSPDGRTLATACDDAKVRLWDPVSGQMTLELDGHTRRVNAVAFSPDGRTLASADHAGAIKLWWAGKY